VVVLHWSKTFDDLENHDVEAALSLVVARSSSDYDKTLKQE
jgi:hypothetical protein